jgi:hypothetical protein
VGLSIDTVSFDIVISVTGGVDSSKVISVDGIDVDYIVLCMLCVVYCVLCCYVVYCIALYCVVLHCVVLCCVVLCCIALHCIALHCIVLHCIVLCCVVLYCIEINPLQKIYTTNLFICVVMKILNTGV